MYTATKEFRFEAAHCLDQHRGKCKNLHGHNYCILVTMGATTLNDMDMVMDFYDIKGFADNLFNSFDHSFMYNTKCKDSFEKEIRDVCFKHNRKLVELPMRFTAENMAHYFYRRLSDYLLDKATNIMWIEKITVYETPTSFAEYYEDRK